MDRRLKNNVSGGYFPEIFSNLKKENILELIRILDPNGKGYISVCDFFTYLCVLQSPIMNEERREFYLKHVA
jgi:Ca2+-binding EF-hand superfamily protein